MSDGPPPAKRQKYVLPSIAVPLRSFRGRNIANEFLHRYNLTKSFDVLVGKEPDQQRFTVYHDLLTERSEFFRAARSERCIDTPGKPTTLDDAKAEVFSAYLHCVNFGSGSLASLVQSMTEENEDIYPQGRKSSGEDSTDSSDDDDDDDGSDCGDVTFLYGPVEKFLIDLYLLADKLIDPIAANLVMDELINLVEKRDEKLTAVLVCFVCSSTTVASPLRRFIRDYCINATFSSVADTGQLGLTNFPPDCVKDILSEVWAINKRNPDGAIRKVCRRKKTQPKHYHLALGEASADSAGTAILPEKKESK
jgi:hypothetical protein